MFSVWYAAQLFHNTVADIIIEDTTTQLFRPALSAGNAATDGLVAQLHDFILNAILLELVGNLCECRERVAFLVGASV